jgi:GNAT superfamily N-acetyltransferase
VKLEFRLAAAPGDYDIIRRMNNDVFAIEIGQHEPAPDGRLVDGFESRSMFLLAFDSDQPAAMVSFHSQPPYSVEAKLDDPLVLAGLPGPIFEIRLLAIHPFHRGTPLLAALLVRLFGAVRERGARTLVISGIAGRRAMYHSMGFVELGPEVRRGEAGFIPMALDLESLPPNAEAIRRRYAGRMGV